jgi:hypothetical protein
MTVLFKLSLQTAAIAAILLTATACDDSAAAPTPVLPLARLEVGAVRVPHQKTVIKDEIPDCLSARRGPPARPRANDVFLKRLFRAGGGTGPEPPPVPADPAETGTGVN